MLAIANSLSPFAQNMQKTLIFCMEQLLHIIISHVSIYMRMQYPGADQVKYVLLEHVHTELKSLQDRLNRIAGLSSWSNIDAFLEGATIWLQRIFFQEFGGGYA
jgi:hypothetical protein